MLMLMTGVMLSCSKKESTEPDVNPPPISVDKYAGVWTGTTGQSLPVYFHIKPTGEIDSLTIRIKMSFPTFYCTATFVKDSSISVQGNSFVARVKYAGANFVTRMRATLGSVSSSQGSYDSYGGSFSIICGSTWAMGTTGSIISKGTWTATKTGTE
jgi:hypothetical protein